MLGTKIRIYEFLHHSSICVKLKKMNTVNRFIPLSLIKCNDFFQNGLTTAKNQKKNCKKESLGW